VLINDMDPEGHAMTAVQVTNTAHGTLTLNSDGALVYTPNANYNGTDTFTYKANDGAYDSNAAVVTLTIASVNDTPVAEEDSFTVAAGGTLVLYGYEGVLENDEDVDVEDTLTAQLVSGTSHGSLSFYSSGALKYTPASGFGGEDSFVYRAFDGEAYSDPMTVLIEVIEAMTPILGDATGDGKVDEADALILAQHWGTSTSEGAGAGDFNLDGVVNAADASIMAANWGDHSAESARAVPEPGAIVLLLCLFGVAALGRRRRG
jgi:VCBS repeat-containing protein